MDGVSVYGMEHCGFCMYGHGVRSANSICGCPGLVVIIDLELEDKFWISFELRWSSV